MYKYIILKKKEIERPRKDRASVILSSTMKLLGIISSSHNVEVHLLFLFFKRIFGISHRKKFILSLEAGDIDRLAVSLVLH